jgi:flagellar motor switch/type III secretory pathway protein FliN
MKTRAYKLFAKSELTHMRSRLEDIVRQWAKSWITDVRLPAVTVSACEDAHAIHDIHQDFKWHLATASEHQWVAVTLGDDDVHSASRMLMGLQAAGNGHSNHDTALTVGLTKKFLCDLAESVTRQAPCNLDKNVRSRHDSAENLPVETWTHGSGAMCIVISLRSMTIVMIISSDLVSSYLSSLGSLAKTAASLASMKQAIGSAPIELEVGIGNAALSLRELRNMTIGDVIRLDTKLAQPVQVFLNKQCACTGFLGSYRGKKAVLLKSLTS